MDWSEDCSDYEDDDDGEATGTDIDDLPVEELIVVLRDEQVSQITPKKINTELKRQLMYRNKVLSGLNVLFPFLTSKS